MADKTTLNVEGMTCTNCALGVTRFLEKKGLKDVKVDFASGEVTFEEIKSEILPDVVKGIEKLGYHVHQEHDHMHHHTETGAPFYKTLEFRFLISALLTLPLLLHMVTDLELFHNPWFQLSLCTPVYLIGMRYFGKSALSSIKAGVPNMDLLITIGASAAFFYSLAGMFIHTGTGHVANYMFFETTATIITLVMLGNIIEKRSVRRTTSALRELMSIQPHKANRILIGKDMSESVEEVPVKEIKKGDPVLIQTGNAVPVDGTLYWGSLVVDEAALTGESMPADKQNGSKVFAGSVVLSGSAKVVTDTAGTQTVLSNIIELVKEAQRSKPEIQKLGDKVSAWFVPIVVTISFITFLGAYFVVDLEASRALMNAIAVLVISCPCAMGLATPTAVAVGLGKAARNGILIKGGNTLEMFDGLKTAVLDKTGTLTTGNFRVSDLKVYNGMSEQTASDLFYSLEQHSSHPIARSLVNEFGKKNSGWQVFKNVEEIRGLGIKAHDENGNEYIIGSQNSHEAFSKEPGHSVYLAINGKLSAAVNLKDEIKPGARELIQSLRNSGVETVLLSGDQAARCNEIAAELGIDTVYSGKLPDEKTAIIKELKKKGKLVMVGDGINDAPSLAAADIGISFGEASKIAVNSAQVIILKSEDLLAINKAVRIGKMTLQTIRQNLFWAFAYNIVAIPVAAIGLLSPMVAAFSMAFSDVIVIGNSIRLRFRN